MEDEKKNIAQQENAEEEGVELNTEQMEKISGGVLGYDDPRNKDHKDKKDDPRDW